MYVYTYIKFKKPTFFATLLTDSLSEVQTTDKSVASSCDTVVVNCSVLSTTKILVDLFNEKHL